MVEKTKIWGLGIGPGDPDLITLKALRVLQKADVIAYPALQGGESIVRSIVDRHLKERKEEVIISIPMEIERHPAQDVFDSYAREIGRLADSGKTIAVLCEGDPFFYGSFMYLHMRLSTKYNIKVIPGVTSLTACAAQAGFPLASRNDIISIIPGPLEDSILEQKLLTTNVAAIIKVGKHLKKIRGIIKKLGKIENAYYVERATFEKEKISPLIDFDENFAPYFSMILVYMNAEILGMKK